MISVSTDSYFALVRAAQMQAIRIGVPLGDKQSVPVAISEQALPPVPVNPAENVRQIVNVIV